MYDDELNSLSGNEYSAVVEFAPSQKLPSANQKADTRQGTIEDDEDYKNFVALIEKGENPSKDKAPATVSGGKFACSAPISKSDENI
jgi:regulator of nonsense transcripts 3